MSEISPSEAARVHAARALLEERFPAETMNPGDEVSVDGNRFVVARTRVAVDLALALVAITLTATVVAVLLSGAFASGGLLAVKTLFGVVAAGLTVLLLDTLGRLGHLGRNRWRQISPLSQSR